MRGQWPNDQGKQQMSTPCPPPLAPTVWKLPRSELMCKRYRDQSITSSLGQVVTQIYGHPFPGGSCCGFVRMLSRERFYGDLREGGVTRPSILWLWDTREPGFCVDWIATPVPFVDGVLVGVFVRLFFMYCMCHVRRRVEVTSGVDL